MNIYVSFISPTQISRSCHILNSSYKLMDEFEDILWRAIDKGGARSQESWKALINWLDKADKETLQTSIELIKYGLVTDSYKEDLGSEVLKYAKGLERGLKPPVPQLLDSPVVSAAESSSDPESASEDQDGMMCIDSASGAVTINSVLSLAMRRLYNVFFNKAKEHSKDFLALYSDPTPELHYSESERPFSNNDYYKNHMLALVLNKDYGKVKAGTCFNFWKSETVLKFRDRAEVLSRCLKIREGLKEKNSVVKAFRRMKVVKRRPDSRLTPADKRDILRKVVKMMVRYGRTNNEQRALWKWDLIVHDYTFTPTFASSTQLGIKFMEKINDTKLASLFKQAESSLSSIKSKVFNLWSDPSIKILNSISKRTRTQLEVTEMLKQSRKNPNLPKLTSQFSHISQSRSSMNQVALWKWLTYSYTASIKAKTLSSLFNSLNYLRSQQEALFHKWRVLIGQPALTSLSCTLVAFAKPLIGLLIEDELSFIEIMTEDSHRYKRSSKVVKKNRQSSVNRTRSRDFSIVSEKDVEFYVETVESAVSKPIVVVEIIVEGAKRQASRPYIWNSRSCQELSILYEPFNKPLVFVEVVHLLSIRPDRFTCVAAYKPITVILTQQEEEVLEIIEVTRHRKRNRKIRRPMIKNISILAETSVAELKMKPIISLQTVTTLALNYTKPQIFKLQAFSKPIISIHQEHENEFNESEITSSITSKKRVSKRILPPARIVYQSSREIEDCLIVLPMRKPIVQIERVEKKPNKGIKGTKALTGNKDEIGRPQGSKDSKIKIIEDIEDPCEFYEEELDAADELDEGLREGKNLRGGSDHSEVVINSFSIQAVLRPLIIPEVDLEEEFIDTFVTKSFKKTKKTLPLISIY